MSAYGIYQPLECEPTLYTLRTFLPSLPSAPSGFSSTIVNGRKSLVKCTGVDGLQVFGVTVPMTVGEGVFETSIATVPPFVEQAAKDDILPIPMALDFDMEI